VRHCPAPPDPELALQRLGRVLPDPPADDPGDRLGTRIVGELLYTTAVTPCWNGEVRYRGQLGGDLSAEEGAAAAELCVLNLLSLIRDRAGSLDRVARIERLAALICCTPDFENLGEVLDGASRLVYAVFGERGRHVRHAFATDDPGGKGPAVRLNAVVRLRLDAGNGLARVS